jgi:hypothetical protein
LRLPDTHRDESAVRGSKGRPSDGRAGAQAKAGGGESVSQSPLKEKVFPTFLNQNPPFEQRPEKGIPPSTKACNAVFRDWWRGLLPSEGKGHTFESCRVRQLSFIFQRDVCARTENPIQSHLIE